jgi:hypothetical protein
MIELNTVVDARLQMLLQEAAYERLAALVQHDVSGPRRALAVACVRLASWLEADRYEQPGKTGRSAWVRTSVSA